MGSNGQLASIRRVPVGPFQVVDLPQEGVVSSLAKLARAGLSSPTTAFALHVGGLVARHDEAFVAAMQDADIVYADGASVVLLAKLAGARRITRAPTTDIGWELLRGLSEELGRPPTVSVIGGPDSLATEALGVLVDAGIARRGVSAHGYHEDWGPVLEQMRRTPSDVLLVGLGAPAEMLWVHTHRAELATRLVLTCGGWLGFLAGYETRAPGLMQRWSLEWVFRLAGSPRRLAQRYARGFVATAVLAAKAVTRRWFGRRPHVRGVRR